MALTPKQEAFCLAIVEGKTQSEAYRLAYDTSKMKPESVHRLAKASMDDVKIASRIAELRQPAIDRAGLTYEKHLENLEELKRLAAAAGQYSAAIVAETNRGKASGLYTERVKHSGEVGLTLNILPADLNL